MRMTNRTIDNLIDIIYEDIVEVIIENNKLLLEKTENSKIVQNFIKTRQSLDEQQEILDKKYKKFEEEIRKYAKNLNYDIGEYYSSISTILNEIIISDKKEKVTLQKELTKKEIEKLVILNSNKETSEIVNIIKEQINDNKI